MPTPNTTFVSGAVLTAAQQNNFPRGVMAYNTATASDATVTAEEVQITGSSFTAVANRNYRITYFEPYVASNAANCVFTMRIRQTNLAGAVQNSCTVLNIVGSVFFGTSGICQAVSTFSAGTVNLVGTLAASAGTGQASRSATQYAMLLVEDIGPV
jgi:hypothetical protein